MSSSNFDPKDFRRALGQFPTGVTVITTLDAQGEPVGVTASSFNSVSMDPALVLWSIDKGAFSLETFRNAEYFAVNVLSREQVDISNRFASRGEDKFSGIEYSAGAGGAPLLADYAAQFECRSWQVYEGGDHLILVGEVVDYRYRDIHQPLVFSRGSYAVSVSHPAMAKSGSDTPVTEFIGDYLLYLLRETYNRFSQELYPKLKEQCGVTPEEWRILAVLSDCEQMAIADLAPLVMQPEVALSQTAEWMVDKGLLSALGSEQVALTDSGRTLAAELLALAKSHEAEVLGQLPAEQATLLKQSLKTLLAAK